ncbi:toprim domain-containing protein [Vibrio sp. TRT 29B02]|uniref:toprim domain-containing protein n=1 Tax=Vibrio sp. TRT 29B02 TaxID=3418508 RepID=UPI003CE819F8
MNGRRIIISESPLAASAIQRASGIDVMATYGHLFDYQYINKSIGLVAKNPNLVKQIALQNSPDQTLIIATDNDAQGELIAQHIQAITPRATHQRIHISELTKDGIQNALSRPVPVNHQLANEGAYIRMLNLKLSKLEPRGVLTTTSITLAKSIEDRGRLNQLQNYTIAHKGQEYYTRYPEALEKNLDAVLQPLPAVTRNLTMLAAFQNITNIHNAMQDLYQARRLSYIRTDSPVLPQTNLLYSEHISETVLDSAHYAIYNLTPYQNDIERYVYKINESAVSNRHHALEVRTSLGSILAIDEPLPIGELRPACELMLHLSLDENAFASTISSAAQKYEKVFFTGSYLDDSSVSRIRSKAQRLVPDIYERGIKSIIASENPITVKHVSEQEIALEKVVQDRRMETSFAPDSDANNFMAY